MSTQMRASIRDSQNNLNSTFSPEQSPNNSMLVSQQWNMMMTKKGPPSDSDNEIVMPQALLESDAMDPGFSLKRNTQRNQIIIIPDTKYDITENVSPTLTMRDGSGSPRSPGTAVPMVINSRYASPKKALKPFKISDMHIKIRGSFEQQAENTTPRMAKK